MRARFTKAFVAVGVVGTALAGVGCRKSSEEQRRDSQKATEEAEQKASQTTITNAEVGAHETQEAQAEAISAARNEQLEYRGKLQAALDELDTKRREAKKRGHVHVKAIDAKREVLRHHLDALDRSTDTDWASLKGKIDRDLRDHVGVEGR